MELCDTYLPIDGEAFLLPSFHQFQSLFRMTAFRIMNDGASIPEWHRTHRLKISKWEILSLLKYGRVIVRWNLKEVQSARSRHYTLAHVTHFHISPSALKTPVPSTLFNVRRNSSPGWT